MRNLILLPACVCMLLFSMCNQSNQEQATANDTSHDSSTQQSTQAITSNLLQPNITADSAKMIVDDFRNCQGIDIPLAWSFTKDQLETMLENGDGIRFYAAKNSSGHLTLVAVGYNNISGPSNTEDRLTDSPELIFDLCEECPPKCSKDNAIFYNSATSPTTPYHFQKQ